MTISCLLEQFCNICKKKLVINEPYENICATIRDPNIFARIPVFLLQSLKLLQLRGLHSLLVSILYFKQSDMKQTKFAVILTEMQQ